MDGHHRPDGSSTRSRALRALAGAALCGTLLLAPPALAAPTTLAVQGRLGATGGGPVADGDYTLTFALYADVNAPQPLWTEIHIAVAVVGGRFDAVLGSKDPLKPLDSALFAAHPAAAVGVQVGVEPELPRVTLRPVPYANSAAGLSCTGCVALDALAPGVLAASNVTLNAGGQQSLSVADALLPMVNVLKVNGASAGVGKVPGPGCGLDLATDGGTACLDGLPALWTVIASTPGAMAQVATEGQLVYRLDEQKAWMRVGGFWREVAFKALCGDGNVEAGEECDDGPANADAPDACRTTCKSPTCGDGIQDAGEACDDGNAATNDACVPGCKQAACGDGYLHAGVELCDDGNLVATDTCTNACEPAACGDGVVQSGVEDCDDGNANANVADACRTDCTAPTCGDGIIDSGEECDDGQANADVAGACRTTCKNPTCGDGILDGGEECDDGNNSAGDGCDPQCVKDVNNFKGYATWSQNVSGQSDAAQDQLMDSVCSSKYPGSQAATIEQIYKGQINGLPGSNSSGDHLLGKCPECAGNNSGGAVSGHCRKCVDPGASWPQSANSGWNTNCCNSNRTAICVGP